MKTAKRKIDLEIKLLENLEKLIDDGARNNARV